jgi:hypothetical protein
LLAVVLLSNHLVEPLQEIGLDAGQVAVSCIRNCKIGARQSANQPRLPQTSLFAHQSAGLLPRPCSRPPYARGQGQTASLPPYEPSKIAATSLPPRLVVVYVRKCAAPQCSTRWPPSQRAYGRIGHEVLLSEWRLPIPHLQTGRRWPQPPGEPQSIKARALEPQAAPGLAVFYRVSGFVL